LEAAAKRRRIGRVAVGKASEGVRKLVVNT